MVGRGWRETGGGNIWRESIGGIIRGKGCAKIFFFHCLRWAMVAQYSSAKFKKKSFGPNISRRVKRDSMAGDIGGKNCS